MMTKNSFARHSRATRADDPRHPATVCPYLCSDSPTRSRPEIRLPRWTSRVRHFSGPRCRVFQSPERERPLTLTERPHRRPPSPAWAHASSGWAWAYGYHVKDTDMSPDRVGASAGRCTAPQAAPDHAPSSTRASTGGPRRSTRKAARLGVLDTRIGGKAFPPIGPKGNRFARVAVWPTSAGG